MLTSHVWRKYSQHYTITILCENPSLYTSDLMTLRRRRDLHIATWSTYSLLCCNFTQYINYVFITLRWKHSHSRKTRWKEPSNGGTTSIWSFGVDRQFLRIKAVTKRSRVSAVRLDMRGQRFFFESYRSSVYGLNY